MPADLAAAQATYERARHVLYLALVNEASAGLIGRLLARVQAARQRVLQLETEAVTS